ncbi:glycosyl hydrolase 115 family protein [Paenibacillus sedimenti]|nr:glycosyl hydrolase 115 family protein [Paenibacillus sedimenti]
MRDLQTVLGELPELTELSDDNVDIVVRLASEEDVVPKHPEGFSFQFRENSLGTQLQIIGKDDLGLVYGILYFTERYLGIHPFWFWADQTVLHQERLTIPIEPYESSVSKVRFRGWFVNDEVCLIGWKDSYPPSREIWEHVFEALLRCRGNMVIPGTDLPKSGVHFDVAAEMGLWITHHHAEPLGAEMFLRAYPGKRASYQEAPELFEHLWSEAIEKQKDHKVLWVLSFRGQGDKPFWENDPSFDTPEKRGAMISKVIRRQYDLIGKSVKDPVYCVALYGEIAELYKGGFIDLPDDVIKVWADNGYGAMVSRRHGNLNLRVLALPERGDTGKHGIYYHVTFHDLQASNHLTMSSGSATFLKKEVEGAFAAGADDYLLLNCGNIRPHVYTLDILRTLWNEGTIEIDSHLEQFVRNYYEEGHVSLKELYRSYTKAAISYGPNPDDLAGDEYYHHPARRIMGHWLQGKGDETDERLIWATGEVSFAEQVRSFARRCEEGLAKWNNWVENCDKAIYILGENDKKKAIDQLRFHGALHRSGCEGFLWLCHSYAAYSKKQYPQAFVYASQSLWSYEEGLHVLRGSEQGKWEHFYRADWLTNIESTVRNVDTVRRFLRMQGDSPEFFLWYKEYLMPETEKHIYLENTHRNPLSDDELARRLKVYFEKSNQA